jgi:hypothetical protein
LAGLSGKARICYELHPQGMPFQPFFDGASPMRNILFPAVLILAVPAAAVAQDYGLGGMDSFISVSNSNMLMTDTIVRGESFKSSLRNKMNGQKAKSAGAPQAPMSEAVPLAALTFKPAPAIRTKSKERFFANMRKIDPQGAREMEARYANRDLFAALDQAMAGHGLRYDNVADAFTVWMINIWLGANGLTDDPPPAQIKAVSAQIAAALGLSPDLAKASDAQKQELAEGLLLNAAVIGGALADPRATSAEGRAQLQKAMSQVGSKMGVNLTAIRISDQGFVS